eukprot:2274091-Prorocentrum_lima.AAC.1
MSLTGFDLHLWNRVGQICAGWYNSSGHVKNQLSLPWIRVCLGGIAASNRALYIQGIKEGTKMHLDNINITIHVLHE